MKNIFPNSIDADKLKNGIETTQKNLIMALPFKLLKGRDKIY